MNPEKRTFARAEVVSFYTGFIYLSNTKMICQLKKRHCSKTSVTRSKKGDVTMLMVRPDPQSLKRRSAVISRGMARPMRESTVGAMSESFPRGRRVRPLASRAT